MIKDRTYYAQCNSRELIDAARFAGDDLSRVLADRLEALLEPRRPQPHSDQAYERAVQMRDAQIADMIKGLTR